MRPGLSPSAAEPGAARAGGRRVGRKVTGRRSAVDRRRSPLALADDIYGRPSNENAREARGPTTYLPTPRASAPKTAVPYRLAESRLPTLAGPCVGARLPAEPLRDRRSGRPDLMVASNGVASNGVANANLHM